VLDVRYLVADNCPEFVFIQEASYAFCMQTLESDAHLPNANAFGIGMDEMPMRGIGMPAFFESSLTICEAEGPLFRISSERP